MSKLTPLQATAPRKIWLQISDDADHHAEPFPEDWRNNDSITWCADSVTACQVAYVREDLAQPAATMSATEALPELPELPEPSWGVDKHGNPIWLKSQIREYAIDYARAALAAAPAAGAEPVAITQVHRYDGHDDEGVCVLLVHGVEVVTENMTGGIDRLEELAAMINAAVPAPTAQPQPAEIWHAVINPNGDCGVIFRDKADADFAATGAQVGSFVHTLADEFRELFDEEDEFNTKTLIAAKGEK